MPIFAQIDAASVCITIKESSEPIDQHDHIEIPDFDQSLIGKRWDGTAFGPVPSSPSDVVAAALQRIDTDTGTSRTLREALISIGAKTGADLSYLAAKEAQAAKLRASIK